MGYVEKQGFTLIELSIVLVIIGLVTGGILAGRELIQVAKIRQQIGQLSEYQQAYNAFKNKYGKMPGDLSNTTRAMLGLPAPNASSTPSTLCGNDNGMLEGAWHPGQETVAIFCEPLALFADLSAAGLVQDKISPTNYNAALNIGTSAPAMKLHPEAAIVALPYKDKMGIFMGMNKDAAGTQFYWLNQHYANKLFPPEEAYALDAKLDDGRPLTGNTIAVLQSIGSFALESAANACITSTAANTYNVTEETAQCFLWARNP